MPIKGFSHTFDKLPVSSEEVTLSFNNISMHFRINRTYNCVGSRLQKSTVEKLGILSFFSNRFNKYTQTNH